MASIGAAVCLIGVSACSLVVGNDTRTVAPRDAGALPDDASSPQDLPPQDASPACLSECGAAYATCALSCDDANGKCAAKCSEERAKCRQSCPNG